MQEKSIKNSKNCKKNDKVKFICKKNEFFVEFSQVFCNLQQKLRNAIIIYWILQFPSKRLPLRNSVIAMAFLPGA